MNINRGKKEVWYEISQISAQKRMKLSEIEKIITAPALGERFLANNAEDGRCICSHADEEEALKDLNSRATQLNIIMHAGLCYLDAWGYAMSTIVAYYDEDNGEWIEDDRETQYDHTISKYSPVE